ncbi:recombinase family protein [Desertibacillus haloalkaliphilus]|nr:recombinase family protein [Desertibacillus haloalkaliphilus]
MVKRMYDSYAAGKSIVQIARELSEDNIETANGNKYCHPNTVGKMLASPVYKGCVLYQQTYVKDPFTRKQVVNKGELPQYYIEDHHPAIITPEDWDKVQTIRKLNQPKTTRPSVNAPQPFRQTFRCGECGGIISQYENYDRQKDANKNKRMQTRKKLAVIGDVGSPMVKTFPVHAPPKVFVRSMWSITL